ncbi:MAG TPA: hypothetical protein VE197_14550 [Mycobacterium sp.]|nr:hypothetical protein [Mycobacterium sp.]
MIHTQLNYLIAQQRADELRRDADRERFAHSIDAAGRAPVPTRRIARVGAALRLRRPLVSPESM